MRYPLLIAVGVAAVCAMPNAAQSQEAGQAPPRVTAVAVKEFVAQGLSQSEAVTLTDVFRNYLVETGRFRMMERTQMNEILKEQGFQRSGACTDNACVVMMGQLLGVENIVTGSVGRIGGTYTVSARLVSVETGEIVRMASKFHKGEIDLLLTEVLPKVAQEMAGFEREAAQAENVEPRGRRASRTSTDVGERRERRPGRALLWIGAGTVLVGGGALAIALLSDDGDMNDEDAHGEVYLTW